MKVEELIKEINKQVDHLDFVAARRLIESNLELLNQYKVRLNSNARELLNILSERQESGIKPLSRNDMATLVAINTYASKFDITSIKLTIKNNASLLLRKDAVDYLNKDAITILESMGVINNK